MLHALASLIQSMLDVVLPRKERALRVDAYDAADLPVSPEAHDACGVRITTLMQYRSRAVEDLVRALKYDGSGHAATVLSTVLAEYLHEEILSTRAFSSLPVVLVPVPLHESRRRERGFNQVEKVLHALPGGFHDGTLTRLSTDLLSRTRATEQQTRLARDARLQNVKDAFVLTKDVHGTHIILLDDVTTTGATLAAAAEPLSSAASLTLIALARA